MLTNLIVNDLFIAFIGVPLDTIGAFTKGQALDYVPCQATAFIHTIFGKLKRYTIAYLIWVFFTKGRQRSGNTGSPCFT